LCPLCNQFVHPLYISEHVQREVQSGQWEREKRDWQEKQRVVRGMQIDDAQLWEGIVKVMKRNEPDIAIDGTHPLYQGEMSETLHDTDGATSTEGHLTVDYKSREASSTHHSEMERTDLKKEEEEEKRGERRVVDDISMGKDEERERKGVKMEEGEDSIIDQKPEKEEENPEKEEEEPIIFTFIITIPPNPKQKLMKEGGSVEIVVGSTEELQVKMFEMTGVPVKKQRFQDSVSKSFLDVKIPLQEQSIGKDLIFKIKTRGGKRK
ncbi:hypothetical protein ADUPG1_000152, partial [Aduncisulcus paluster]